MCAIFGFFQPKFPHGTDKARLIRSLARKCQMYGDKSFGIFGNFNGTPKLDRYTGPATGWVSSQSKNQWKGWASSRVIVGHTRWPTRGAVSIANCHPFHLGDWVACHNGCISNSTELQAEASLAAGGETDSEEALAYVISEKWSKESMQKIRGGFAFAGVTKDFNKGILVCDNRQRLHFVKLGDGYVWCTDGQDLVSSLEASGCILPADTKIYKLENQILHLHTGEIEELGAAEIELDRWERDLLRGTQTGGGNVEDDDIIGMYGMDFRGNGKRGSRRGGTHQDRRWQRSNFTSTPIDLSIGRQLRLQANGFQGEDEVRVPHAPIWPIDFVDDEDVDVQLQARLQVEIEQMKAESQEEREQISEQSDDSFPPTDVIQ